MAIALKGVFAAVLVGVALPCAISPTFAQDAQEEERWNAYGQVTYIAQRKDAFPAAYTNSNGSPNSLLPDKERSWSATATAYLGLRAWQGAEIYFVPEMIAQVALSELHGLGGSVQNGELEKTGFSRPIFYRSRLFLRETWNLGGQSMKVESGPTQLSKSVDSRRFVLTAGNLAIIDIFDRNAYAGDIRQQFLSMNFATHAAWDFAADARGYSWGVAGEYFHEDWAFRAGRFLVPRLPNQLKLNHQIMKLHGDQAEIERKHSVYGRPGKIQVLAYRNVAIMGRWDDAINALRAAPRKNAASCTDFNYGSDNAAAPDLCWVRRTNTKVGVGVSIEQGITEDAGVNFRAMRSDGKTEVDAFVSADSSAAVGAVIKGVRWGRPEDSLGIGYAQNWISAAHVSYLSLGGIDAFIGDGKIRYRPERMFEAYYNINLNKFLWLTLDFQHIENPAYNADRGPVTIYGFRVHAEF